MDIQNKSSLGFSGECCCQCDQMLEKILCQIFKNAVKVAVAVPTLKVMFFKISKKSTKYLRYFNEKINHQ